MRLALVVVASEGFAQGVERMPSRDELVAAFNRVTRSVPSPLYLEVKAVVMSEPGSDEDIERATQRNVEHLESTTGQTLTPGEIDKFRELFRKSMSGEKRIHYQLWRSRRGKLYRLDKIDLSLGENASDFSSVNIWDTTFTNVPSYTASRRLGSADIQWDSSARHTELALWDAIGLEAQLAFPLIVALGTTRSDMDPSRDFELMREGSRIDSGKLERLLEASNPDWRIAAIELPEQNPPQVELTLSGRVVSPENFRGRMPKDYKVSEIEVSYRFDKSDFSRLLRAEFAERRSGVNYVSIRSAFNEQGYPMRWELLERARSDAPVERRVFEFEGIDTFDESEEWEIFAPVFPEHYIVGELDGSGQATIVSNPGGGEILNVEDPPFEWLTRFVAKFVVCCCFLFPVGYFLNVYRRGQRK